jgi:hypothetical protein
MRPSVTLRLSLALALLGGCTRATSGFCESDNDCSLGSYCALPARECTEAKVIRAELSGGQQVPPTASDATGSFRLVVNPEGTSGNWRLTHTVKNPTRAELRIGRIGQANMGSSALATLPLSQSEGTLPLDPDTIRSFTSGEVYLLIGSSTFQTGEVRGQLFSIDPKDASGSFKLSGILSGLQSKPANPSTGRGSIDITYDDAAASLAYSYSISGIKGAITGLHLHRGAFNENGPHVVDLPDTSPMSSGTLTQQDGCTQYKDQCQLFPVLFKSGLVYFNVHTSEVAGGELRAQVQVGNALPFNTALSPKGFTPEVTSPALGEIHFYLSDDKTRLAFRLEHNVPKPTAIELSKPGAMGMPAKVPCAALDTSAGKSGAQGFCDVTTDPSNMQAILQSELLNGSITAVIKSQDFPNGELRGEVRVPMK